MNGFLKAFLGVLAFCAAIVGALAIIDRITAKNRIENDYLDCSEDSPEQEEKEE